MAIFRVGQKVVCINADPHVLGHPGTWAIGEALVEGRVYTVKAVAISPYRNLPAIQLYEQSRPAHWGYGAFRFRPVVERKTDISIFKAMLTPSPERVS